MEKRLSAIEGDIKLIKAALLGHEGNADDGLLAITRKNERDIAEMRVTFKTIWAAIVAIPIIAGAVAFFMPDLPPTRIDRTHT